MDQLYDPRFVAKFETALKAYGSIQGADSADAHMWTCPIHDDSKASLAVATGDDGKPLIFCHSCSSVANSWTVAEKIAAAIGISMEDRYAGTSRKATSDIDWRAGPEEAYDYFGARKEYLFSVFWFPGKQFRQGVKRAQTVDGRRTRSTTKGWQWGEQEVAFGLKGKNVAMVPYRLPALLRALAAGEPVYVVEGERDVNRLQREGVVATCNPGGAGKWLPEFSTFFAGTGSRVYVVPDMDGPTKDFKGERHALAVADSLGAVGVDTQLVRAAHGKDVRDHLEASLDLSDLVPCGPEIAAAVSTADDGKRHEHLEELRQGERDRRQARRDVDAEEAMCDWTEPPSYEHMGLELAIPPKAIDWTVEDLHWRGANTLILAGFKTGKTVLAMNLMKSLADGEPFLGHATALPQDARVAWWNYELDVDQARRWINDLGVRHPERLSHLALRGYAMPLAAKEIVAWAVRWLSSRRVAVWVIDPYGAAFDGEENDNSVVRVWLQNLDRIKRLSGVRDVFLVVHTGTAQQEEGAERARGAVRLEDWRDASWYYTKDPKLPDLRFFRAFGRDVEVKQFGVAFDPLTRALSRDVSVNGSRDEAVTEKKVEQVAAAVAARPGINKGGLRAELGKGENGLKDTWIAEAENMGLIRSEPDPKGGRGILHYPVPQKKHRIPPQTGGVLAFRRPPPPSADLSPANT